jgi:hypothetical protein
MKNLTIYRAKRKSDNNIIYGYPFEDVAGNIIMYHKGKFPKVYRKSLARSTGYSDADNNPIFENDTVYLSIEDSVEPTGRARVKGKVVFYKGCWVFQEDRYDYTLYPIRDFHFMYEINQSEIHLSKAQESIFQS